MSYTFEPFDSWADVLAHVDAKRPIFYWAPLDVRPVRVFAESRRGKVRVQVRDAYPFTADAGHLDRFRREETDAGVASSGEEEEEA